MSAVIGPHVYHLGSHLGFFEIFVFSKFAALFLKLIENIG